MSPMRLALRRAQEETAGTEPVSTAYLERPRLNDGVQVHAPSEEGQPWLLQRGEHQYFRVGADLATLAGRLDGDGDAAQLADRMGAPWTEQAVRAALKTLDDAHLVDRQDPGQQVRRTRRLKYVPPFTFQFTVLRSGTRLAHRITGLRLVSARTLAVLVGVLGAAGAVALMTQRAHLADVLGRPVSLQTMFVILAAVSVTTVAHELGHACLLAHYGGRPGRLGVMLFYLSPAMFCDVSDAWRLNHLQRARVALAGIMVQVGVSGAAACSTAFAGRGNTGDVLMLFAVVNVAAAVVNVVPFVKLDGYIALMSYLDRPNLRDTALASLRDRFVALLSGKRIRSQEPSWLPWFGFLCAIAPIALVVRALGQWLNSLLSLGYFGVALSATITGFVALVGVKAGIRLVRALRPARLRPWRVAALLVVVAALLTAVAGIHMTYSRVGSYQVAADGRVYLMVPSGVDDRPVRAGDRVELLKAGMVLHHTVGTATVAVSQGSPMMIPLTGLIPVTADGVKVPGDRYLLRVDGPITTQQGSVRLHSRSVVLPRWAYERFVRPLFATFD
ncbi:MULTISPECIES: daptide biosynthesis intramembrane metalloprotease [unclassified Streptomyces]|uniref:daptide biosynthesis intramembrane metalloprotease n=1 Tax=unclassified Streptomyces TaxID=2593676 RepID=UPI002E2D2709|nr:daptide biosynthesis intramembrane metalloprotease [Streptomyces sp. NBC_00223]